MGNAIFIFQLEKYGEEKLAWVSHTNEVLLHTKDFIGHLKDMETGQRRYLLTENISYLEPYYEGKSDSKAQFETLKELTLDNPLQQKRLDSLEEAMQLKFDELAKTIKLTQENHGNAAEALKIVKQNNGKQYMDHIREVLKDFTHTEMMLLEERKGDFREHRAKITTLISSALMFFFSQAIMNLSVLANNMLSHFKSILHYTVKWTAWSTIDFSDLQAKDEVCDRLFRILLMNDAVSPRTESMTIKLNPHVLT